MVKEFLDEKDPILRYGGVYTLALACADTSDNDSVRKILHVAVLDTSDDVRRAAVTSLAFLLFKHPAQPSRIVVMQRYGTVCYLSSFTQRSVYGF